MATPGAGYVQLLDNEASYLGQLGEDVTDVSLLWNFAVQQADNALSPVGPALASATDDSVAIPGSLSLSFSRVFAESIAGRDTMGPLGYGWSTPWQTTATIASDGTVTITGAGGAQRVFQPDSRTAGTYFSEPGDTGTLTSDGNGGYLLTEADGTATDYNANGTLNYIQDTNGNRITAGYTSGRLTSLTASSGQSIDIAYNAAGLISSVTDSAGPRHDVHLRSVEPVPDLRDRIQRPDDQLHLRHDHAGGPPARTRMAPCSRSRSPAARTSISPTTARADWPAPPTTAAPSPRRLPTRLARSA